MRAASSSEISREIVGADVLQSLRYFHHFQRVADRVAERLVHVGDQRLHPSYPCGGRCRPSSARGGALHLLLHECARANFHIQHQRIQALTPASST